jgi:hypothetical protein
MVNLRPHVLRESTAADGTSIRLPDKQVQIGAVGNQHTFDMKCKLRKYSGRGPLSEDLLDIANGSVSTYRLERESQNRQSLQ